MFEAAARWFAASALVLLATVITLAATWWLLVSAVADLFGSPSDYVAVPVLAVLGLAPGTTVWLAWRRSRAKGYGRAESLPFVSAIGLAVAFPLLLGLVILSVP